MPKPKKPKKGAPAWMVSFADLQQLLLVFFILLFSMSTTDEAKFNAFMNSLNKALNTEGLGLTDNGESTLNYNGDPMNLLDEITSQKNQQLNDELKEVQEFLGSNDLNGEALTEFISAHKSEEGIILTIKDLVLFDSGSAEIKDTAKDLLDKLAPLIQKKGSDIRVEGHTDNVQLSDSSKYKDNWELSTARASEVVAFILGQDIVKAEQVSVAGYAEYKPVAENDTPENKAKNRRVDIVLISDFTDAEKKAQENVDKAEKDAEKEKAKNEESKK